MNEIREKLMNIAKGIKEDSLEPDKMLCYAGMLIQLANNLPNLPTTDEITHQINLFVKSKTLKAKSFDLTMQSELAQALSKLY